MESKSCNPLKYINKISSPVSCLFRKVNYFNVYQNHLFYGKNVLLVMYNQPEFRQHK